MATVNEIRPQPGKQEMFLSSPADIAIYGGGAGGGKTFALLLEQLRHIDNPLFRSIIFRKTYTQVTQQGGLWDESADLYPLVGGVSRGDDLSWAFPAGSKLKFGYLQTDQDRFKYQGAQIPLICFDELTHFSETQFFYMLSRNRSKSGIPGYIRATCNPDPDSWVASFISWFIDQKTGYPIEERAGKLRWFIRVGGELIWADSKEELAHWGGKRRRPKSMTFIPALLSDNKILEEQDPDYRASLELLPPVEQAQLLGGNWKIRPAAGMYFSSSKWQYIDDFNLPKMKRKVRYWDRAATEERVGTDPDWTVGCLMGFCEQDRPFVLDIERFRDGPAGVLRKIQQTAAADGKGVEIYLEQDPGQAGKVEVQYLISNLKGFDTTAVRADKKKKVRAIPFSSQVQAGNVTLVRAAWNKPFVDELESFDGEEKTKDDQVDASSGAFNALTEKKGGKMMFGRA